MSRIGVAAIDSVTMMVRSSVFSRQRAGRVADGEQHEGELATLRQRDAEAARRAGLQPLPAPERVEDTGLDQDECRDESDHREWTGASMPRVERHADRGEEQPEQQAFERLDVGFELVAIGGFGQQRAGDEGAERRRQAGSLHEDGHADDRQQCRGRHRLLDARPRDEPEQLSSTKWPTTTTTAMRPRPSRRR